MEHIINKERKYSLEKLSYFNIFLNVFPLHPRFWCICHVYINKIQRINKK